MQKTLTCAHVPALPGTFRTTGDIEGAWRAIPTDIPYITCIHSYRSVICTRKGINGVGQGFRYTTGHHCKKNEKKIQY